MMSGAKKKIVLIASEETLRDPLSMAISGDDQYDLLCLTTTGALNSLSFQRPADVFIIELPPVPSSDDVGSILKIRQLYYPGKILIVSECQDPAIVLSCFKAGASGYLTTTDNITEEIIHRLDELNEGGAPLSSGISRLVVESFHLRTNGKLTRRELEILQLLADGKTYTGISRILDIARETSKKHIQNLYAKLEVHSKDQAIAEGIMRKIVHHRSRRNIQA